MPMHEQDYGGFWRRFLASLLDSVAMLIVALPLGIALSVMGLSDDGPLWEVLNLALPALATVAFWAWMQTTPGKWLLGLRLVDADTGQAPRLSQCLVRYLGYFVSALVLCLGFFWIAWDARKQGWHDKMANTLVVRV